MAKLMDKTKQLQMPVDLYGRADHERKHNGASYIWLAYSIFFFIEPLVRHSLTYWIQQALWYCVFLALYVAYVQFEAQWIRVALVAGMFGLGVATIPYNVGGSCFFIYVAAMLPFCVESLWVLWSVIAVEAATLAIENHFAPGNPYNYMITGFFAVVVG